MSSPPTPAAGFPRLPRGRGHGLGALLALALSLCALPAHAGHFGLADVSKLAQKLARAPYDDPVGQVPRWLMQLSYDQWRDIRFRPERALWAGSRRPFTVQFFHPGLFYDRTVRIHVVTRDGIQPVAFSPDQFDYGHNNFASRVPQDLGYAGFRLHYPIKTPSYRDEVIVFLGASYFRAVGRDQGFGLSARGLAIDTALSSGEEFPRFREFWLVRPDPGARQMVVYALLDSPSATGAYRFTVVPGVETRVDVEMQLFQRQPVKKLGIAPLTSMFLRGEGGSSEPVDDFRPEVHDSDGLLLDTSAGEWIWRPLVNPDRLLVSSFQADSPRGFGLLQRDRDFDHYQDLEARPELRPSAWVEPRGSWGPGHVELVEIPTRRDTNDNIVAYWVPEDKGAAPSPRSLAYSLYWYGDDHSRPPEGRAVATRQDAGTVDGGRRFVVDFEGPALSKLPENAVVEGVVTAREGGGSQGKGAKLPVLEQQVIHNPVTDGWRLVFQVHVGDEPIELRAFLKHGDDVLTETWSFLLAH